MGDLIVDHEVCRSSLMSYDFIYLKFVMQRMR